MNENNDNLKQEKPTSKHSQKEEKIESKKPEFKKERLRFKKEDMWELKAAGKTERSSK